MKKGAAAAAAAADGKSASSAAHLPSSSVAVAADKAQNKVCPHLSFYIN